MISRHFRICTLAAALLLAGCATRMETDPNAPTGAPDATLSLHQVQAGYRAAASIGSGTIRYRGEEREFTISSLGAGGIGAQSISATGKVYRLNSLSDFPGTYTGMRSGRTILNGTMHEKLTNSKGVVIYLSGTSSGLAGSRGVDKVLVELR